MTARVRSRATLIAAYSTRTVRLELAWLILVAVVGPQSRGVHRKSAVYRDVFCIDGLC